MNVAFYTLGCKVNQYETEAMRETFEKAGHVCVGADGAFDAAVINSCTVTAESDRKTRQILRRFRKSNPNAAIILTGCMVQAFPELADAFPEADVIAGNTDVAEIVTLTEKFLSDGERIIKILPHREKARFNTPAISAFSERTRAYIKIEDGCERYCSYCIIPSARGFVRSKPPEDIKAEAAALAKNGFSEIVLVGINLSAYGSDGDFDLCDAVEAAAFSDGIKRVRLGSLEPDLISDEMLERFKKCEKFCPQFHISLQSGCDRTLKRMNRRYDTAFYTELVTRIRKMFPDAALTTDVMVGFAGETEEEFRESVNYVRKIGFAKTHVFAYSRRKGTVAYGLPGQVPNAEKSRRSREMIAAAAKAEEEFLRSQIGKTFKALFETTADGKSEGYTENYSRVAVKSDRPLDGEIREVIIDSVKDGVSFARLVK